MPKLVLRRRKKRPSTPKPKKQWRIPNRRKNIA